MDDFKLELQSAEKYLDLADSIFVASDMDQNIIFINKKTCQVLECTKEEIIGRNWYDAFISDEAIGTVKSEFQNLVLRSGEGTHIFEDTTECESGIEKAILWSRKLIKDDYGVIIGIINTGEDISDIKQMKDDFSGIELKYLFFNQKSYNLFSTEAALYFAGMFIC